MARHQETMPRHEETKPRRGNGPNERATSDQGPMNGQRATKGRGTTCGERATISGAINVVGAWGGRLPLVTTNLLRRGPVVPVPRRGEHQTPWYPLYIPYAQKGK